MKARLHNQRMVIDVLRKEVLQGGETILTLIGERTYLKERIERQKREILVIGLLLAGCVFLGSIAIIKSVV